LHAHNKNIQSQKLCSIIIEDQSTRSGYANIAITSIIAIHCTATSKSSLSKKTGTINTSERTVAADAARIRTQTHQDEIQPDLCSEQNSWESD